MRLINKINNTASQRMILTGNPNQRIILDVRFLPSMQQWVMDVEYEDFIAKNLTIVSSPNILRSYKNIIPFGLFCETDNGLDPYRIDDFNNGESRLYLLNETDIANQESLLFS